MEETSIQSVKTEEIYSIKDRFRGYLPVVVDVETAGMDPKTDALLEVAMMTVKMDEHGFFCEDEIFSANIRPFEGANINQANIDFLGIDPFDESRNLQTEQEALLPMFKAVSKAIKKNHCKRAILVGHNAHFDLGFINAAAERLGSKNKNPFHPFSVLDTSSMSALAYGQTVLAKACRVAGLKFNNHEAHCADYDTRMECRLFCSILNRYTIFAGLPPKNVDDEA